MTLGDLIKRLKKADKNIVVQRGFCDPHSYRGSYECLAFELSEKPMTVGEMLKVIKPCLGKTFTGYKGGDFEMSDYTDVYIANYGECGDGISNLLLDYMLGEMPTGSDE